MIRERVAPTALFVALPHDPSGRDGTTHWWRVAGDTVEAGVGEDWIVIAADGRTKVIGMAPAALVRMAFSTRVEGVSSVRQAATVARVAALEQSLGDPETLHTVSVLLDSDPPMIVTAVAANAKMQEWLDWAERLGVGIDHIIPAAMVLPLADEWTAASIGNDRIVGRRGTILPDEPALKDALIGAGEQPVELEPRDLELALIGLADVPRPDLRTGRFARRRRIVIDRTRIRELALFLLALVFVTTVISIIAVLKLDTSRAALDAEALEIARSAAGPGVTLDNAEAMLAARAGPTGGRSLSSGVAAVLVRLQPEQNVSLSTLGYSGGSLTFTLSGQGPDAINRVLLALQRDGYQVTAVPRTQGNGQTFADVTLGSGL